MRADCLPFAQVTVRVNGRDLEEHQTEPADEANLTKATTYVECVAGAEFSVHLLLEPGFAYVRDQLNFSVHVDGQWIGARLVELSSLTMGSATCEVAGKTEFSNGTHILRKLKFAAHETSKFKKKSFQADEDH